LLAEQRVAGLVRQRTDRVCEKSSGVFEPSVSLAPAPLNAQAVNRKGLLMMMHAFLTNNRSELIGRCKAKVAARPKRAASEGQLANGIPMFLIS
jgi:hypothetical protein